MSTYHIFGAVVVMLLWSLCFPLINIGLSSSPPMLFAGMRALIAGSLLILLARFLHRSVPTSITVWIGVLVVGLTATSLGFFGMFYGGGLISPGIATVLANTQPLIAAVIAYFWLKEKLSYRQRIGLMLGFFGIIFISVNFGNDEKSISIIGVIYILTGAIGVALGNVTLKWLAGRGDIWMLMGLQLVLGSIPLFILYMLFENTQSIDWNIYFLMALLILSVFGTAAVAVLWFALLEHVELSRINVFTFLTPVFGLVVGYLYFSETLDRYDLMGITLCMMGIYLVSYHSKQT